MQLREADWRDLAMMAALEREIFPDDAWSEATMWAELAMRPRRAYLVADDGVGGSSLVGYAGLDLAGDVADVMTVAVDPRARGRGLGAALLAGLHGLARDAGSRAVMLEVRADNEPAVGLYGAHGYEVLRTRRGYYGDPAGGPARDALIMRKELDENG
ncbi:ribosomal protein S18-alanine N-acetyltransferase [Ornithinimicrobium pratense]|uniref:Ribosomal-protein-alanine N-acetyltransferase n=1 Tax=Ornithinimicrobium pratense TaxID=2593973 RepID=A0A5J6V588_9MICO|nr:ribosomal protein S18-alanine N-acetyltransferase [Ornithinimicrobium pratense]QFG69150.1 ribosomal-protein-alanine N-acetyltransferase [Ornithinimicrobium pratense]